MLNGTINMRIQCKSGGYSTSQPLFVLSIFPHEVISIDQEVRADVEGVCLAESGML